MKYLLLLSTLLACLLTTPLHADSSLDRLIQIVDQYETLTTLDSIQTEEYLSVVTQLGNKNEGTINVISQLNQGTTFEVFLPMMKGA